MNKPVSTAEKRKKLKASETGLQTLQSGPFQFVEAGDPIPESLVTPKVEPPKPAPSDMREPIRPGMKEVRPSAERHRLRAAEEYPMDGLEGSKYHIARPYRPGENKQYPNGTPGDYPEGFDLQWVGVTIWGQHQPQIEAEYTRKGWEPVHHGDFDGRYDGRFLPRSHVGPIIVDGLMLVARPMAWSDKARGLANREAHNRVAIKVGQLKAGELEGVSLNTQHKHLSETNFVNVDVETVSTPKR